MKASRFVVTLFICCLAACATLAASDAIQLRSGRHLEGKFIGGTTTTIGFMTANSIEYFPTSDVLILIFEANKDTPAGELQPNPLKRNAVSGAHVARLSRTSSGTQSPKGRKCKLARAGITSPVQIPAN